MTKIKIGAFGSPFSHDVTSCFGNTPNKFEWAYNQECDVNVYMDYNFLGGTKTNFKNKFLWLCESRELFLPQYEYIKNNLNLIKTVYKKVFTHDKELIDLDPVFEYCPAGSNKSWIQNGQIYTKTKLCSMICSGNNITQGHKYRNFLMYDYKNKNLPIDFYGRSHNPFNKKEEALANYYFSIVVENGKYSNYYTEKIMDCFATGTIPVYYGSPDIHKDFNIDGMIILDKNFNFNDLTVELYYSKINAIHDNFIREKNHIIADDVLFEKILKHI